jgi:hypothetical protein
MVDLATVLIAVGLNGILALLIIFWREAKWRANLENALNNINKNFTYLGNFFKPLSDYFRDLSESHGRLAIPTPCQQLITDARSQFQGLSAISNACCIVFAGTPVFTSRSTSPIDLIKEEEPIIDEIVDELKEVKNNIEKDLENIVRIIRRENEICEKLAKPQLNLVSRLFLLGFNELDKVKSEDVERVSRMLRKRGYRDPFPIISLSIVIYILKRYGELLPSEIQDIKSIAAKAEEQYEEFKRHAWMGVI